MELGAPSRADQREADLRRGVAQLSNAMRSATPPAAPEGLSNADLTAPKVPIPRSRPAAASLVANVSGAAEPRQESATGPFNVGEAIRNVFAMLPPGLKLASANPDGGILSDGQDKAPDLTVYGKQTALYDISARTVYMPGGSRLEAHSGLGELLDDVRAVDVHDRGPTPPNIYELTLREKLFHGVQALRLRPVGDGKLFGRSGLLVHSNLMGPTGDSNGCVSIKDYDAFLNAFSTGDVKRLVVVKSVGNDAIKIARGT
jgi:hypothetical protein